jgi:hypothetical protein
MRNGFPATGAIGPSASPGLENASGPSFSIAPAHTRHRIGRSAGAPKTSPRQTTMVANTASMAMSGGREVDAEGSAEEAAVEDENVLDDFKAECSWAE